MLLGFIVGLVAEWLRRGLQILAPRFDSGRGLHKINSLAAAPGLLERQVSGSSAQPLSRPRDDLVEQLGDLARREPRLEQRAHATEASSARSTHSGSAAAMT